MKKLLLTATLSTLGLISLSSSVLADDACTPFTNMPASVPVNIVVPPNAPLRTTLSTADHQNYKALLHKGTGKIICDYSTLPPRCYKDVDISIPAEIHCKDINGVPVITGQITNTMNIQYPIDPTNSSLTRNGTGYKLHIQGTDIMPIKMDAYI